MATPETELVEVRIVLEVRPMTAEERKECGDEFWDEELDGGEVGYATDDIADGIAGLLECEEYAAEIFAGSGHFLKILGARANGATLVGADEVA